MSAPVLLNLLNMLRKRDKMRGLQRKIILKLYFWYENIRVLSYA